MQTDSIFWASDSESATQQRGREREREREGEGERGGAKFYITYQKAATDKTQKEACI